MLVLSATNGYGAVIQRNADGEYIWYLNTYTGSGALGLKGITFNKKGREIFAPIIKKCAATYSLPWQMLDAVIRVESAYNADAKSPKGAYGLAQLMPSTADDLGVDRTIPEQNICGGAKYLSLLFAQYDDWKLTLAAYNAGAGNVAKYGGVPPFKETKKYLIKVLAIYDGLINNSHK